VDGVHCLECGVKIVNSSIEEEPRPGLLAVPQMRYPNAYVWLVLVSSLDIILTLLVLAFWGGNEVNPIADAVIEVMGFAWAIVFKFALIVLVVILCEIVGRLNDRAGRALAKTAVVIGGLPVLYTFALLLTAGPSPLIQ